MEDFDLWSEADWQKACKYGFTVAGGLLGRAFGGLASTVSAGTAAALTVPAGATYGAALGLAAGLMACRYVPKEKVERLLSGQPMSRPEAAQVLSALARLSGVKSKDHVLRLAASLRSAHAAGPRCDGAAAPARSNGSPAAYAHVLLAQPRHPGA